MSNKAARSIADVAAGKIVASVDITAPPERVFAALSDGHEIERWWRGPGAYATESWVSDFKVGGRWRADGVSADGTPFFVGGAFLEIDPPWKIVQTWAPGWLQGPPTTVTYQLGAIGGGTRVLVRHEGFLDRAASCQDHAEGWIAVLGWLAADIGPKPPPDTSKYFLARLLGPRPDFARTLSGSEMAMMQAHMRYWMPMLDSGKVLVLGPVDDPKWTWGLGVMKVDSEEELLELQGKDPAIVLGKGAMRYENISMFRVAYRQ